jgi:hypothetical protein
VVGVSEKTTKKSRKPKVKEAEPKEVKPTVEEPKEVKETVEVKPPTVEVKLQKVIPPTPLEVKPKEAKVKVTPITLEEFESFTPEPTEKKKSWAKEVIEKASKEPIRVEGLGRGQILALIRAIRAYNLKHFESGIVYKCDIKRGIMLLAPYKSLKTASKP